MKHISFVAFILISCNALHKQHDLKVNDAKYQTSKKEDILNIEPYSVHSKPEIFETAFYQGTKLVIDTLPIHFFPVEIGQLLVESGKIIACDPINLSEAKPFLETFPKGRISVQLSIAKIGNDERVAFARVYFSKNQVVKWEYALKNGEKQEDIDSESIYGYSVDAGIGLYIDENARLAYQKLNNIEGNLWDKIFVTGMNKNYRNTWTYNLFEFNGNNLVSFSTGFGDGFYGCYIGYDKEGRICRLLTDFGLVEWWKK